MTIETELPAVKVKPIGYCIWISPTKLAACASRTPNSFPVYGADTIAETRAAALEEAAKICDGARDNLVIGELPRGVAVGLAAAIRALIPREE
jgi:hypothetical protein